MPLLDYHADALLVFKYQSGAAVHRQKLHVVKFDPASLAYDVPSAVAAGKLNFAGDADIKATAAAWLAIVKGNYGTDYTIGLDHALLRQDDGSYSPIFVTGVASVVGTDSGADANTPIAAGEVTITMHDDQGHQARAVFLGAMSWYGYPQLLSGAEGVGWGPEVGFLHDANHPIVSKHGRALVGPGRVTFALNKKMRRKFGLD